MQSSLSLFFFLQLFSQCLPFSLLCLKKPRQRSSIIFSFLFVLVSLSCHIYIYINTIHWVPYKQQKFINISYRSGGWKSEISLPTWLYSGENPLLVCRFLTSYCILTWWKEGERGPRGPFFKSMNLIHQYGALMI